MSRFSTINESHLYPSIELDLSYFPKVYETCAKYAQLQKEWKEHGASLLFRDQFDEFYVLKYMENSVKSHFFTLFEQEKLTLHYILSSLQSQSEGNTLYLSYATKLMNMFDPEYPIYDTNVALYLGITRPESIDTAIATIEDLQLLYDTLLQRQEVISLISTLKAEGDTKELPDKRILDIILWILGDIAIKDKDAKKGKDLHEHLQNAELLYNSIIKELLTQPASAHSALVSLHNLQLQLQTQGILKGKRLENKKEWDEAIKKKTEEFIIQIRQSYGDAVVSKVRSLLHTNGYIGRGYKHLEQSKSAANSFIQSNSYDL